MASTAATPLSASAKKLSDKTLKERQGRTDRTLAWLAGGLVLFIVALLWCVSRFVVDKSGTGGNTVVGYTLGILTLILYGVVAAYSMRHRHRRQKNTMMRTWMEVHLAFGLVAGVAAVLHSGPKLGAPVHGAFLLAWLLLIGTGVYGKLVSVMIPRRLTKIEDEALLVEDVVERQKAMRLEAEQLLQDADEAFLKLVNDVVPGKIKSPISYGKRRMKRADVAEEVYQAVDGDNAVPVEKRDLLKRLVTCLVEDKFLGKQLTYHYLLRSWVPLHVGLTTLCFPWLIFHVISVLIL